MSARRTVSVRVGPYCALLGWSRRRNGGVVDRKLTWLVLGPKRENEPLQPTLANGKMEVLEGGNVRVDVLAGALPPELEPALREAARNLLWAAAP